MTVEKSTYQDLDLDQAWGGSSCYPAKHVHEVTNQLIVALDKVCSARPFPDSRSSEERRIFTSLEDGVLEAAIGLSARCTVGGSVTR